MTQPPGYEPDAHRGDAEPSHPQPGYPQQAYPAPGEPQPGYPYPTPAHPQPAYPPPSPEPGYPPSGYQQGYAQPTYPPPGYPQPGYPVTPQARPRRDGFAIASLVFGILGGILFAVIFGIVALRRIHRNGTRGRALAIAGLVLSALWVPVIALGVFAALSGVHRDAAGVVTGAGRERAASLRLGDCIQTWPQNGIVVTVQVTPCANPHVAEVFATDTLPAGGYPGVTRVQQQTEQLCSARAGSAIQAAHLDGLALGYLYPETSNWSAGDRKVTCIAISRSARSGSVRSSTGSA